MKKLTPRHPNHVVGYRGSHAKLAKAILNMSYDEVASLLKELAAETLRQSQADEKRPSQSDPTKKRKKLAKRLSVASKKFLDTKKEFEAAWTICKPYM